MNPWVERWAEPLPVPVRKIPKRERLVLTRKTK